MPHPSRGFARRVGSTNINLQFSRSCLHNICQFAPRPFLRDNRTKHESRRHPFRQQRAGAKRRVRAARAGPRGKRTSQSPHPQDRRHRPRNRLERRPQERLDVRLATQRLPLRHLPRRSGKERTRTRRSSTTTCNAPAYVSGSGATRVSHTSRQLRSKLRLERRPQNRNLFLGLFAAALPMWGVQGKSSSYLAIGTTG